MSERRQSRNKQAGQVLDLATVLRVLPPNTELASVQILDLSRDVVASKLQLDPNTYQPTVKRDLLNALPALAQLDLRSYNWSSVELSSATLRKLDLRGNRLTAASVKALLAALPGLELLVLSDAPFKSVTELMLALHCTPGPDLAATALALHIRVASTQSTWQQLRNELTRVIHKVAASVANAQRVRASDTPTGLVLEGLTAEDVKRDLLQRLDDPNKDKEGYKQLFDRAAEDAAQELVRNYSAQLKTLIASMSDADRRQLCMRVPPCASTCQCRFKPLALDLLPSALHHALHRATSSKPAWHRTRMANTLRTAVGTKRVREDTAQERTLQPLPKRVAPVTLSPEPSSLALVTVATRRLGSSRASKRSSPLIRTTPLHDLPHSTTTQVSFATLSPDHKLHLVDQLLHSLTL